MAVVTPDKGKAGKRTEKPPIIQPWTNIMKTEPEARILWSQWIPPGFKEEFEHLDHRWERTVWWHKYELLEIKYVQVRSAKKLIPVQQIQRTHT